MQLYAQTAPAESGGKSPGRRSGCGEIAAAARYFKYGGKTGEKHPRREQKRKKGKYDGKKYHEAAHDDKGTAGI